MIKLTIEQRVRLAQKVEAAYIPQLLKKLNFTKEERRVRLARATMLKKLIAKNKNETRNKK